MDFVWRPSDGKLRFVQVAEQAPEGSQTRTRELAALEDALRERPGSQAVLVTRGDEESRWTVPGGSIRVLPVWRYLIEDEV